MKDNELSARLRERFKDHDTSGFNAADFLGPFGSILEALMYSKLFWPEFVEYRGLVLRAECVEDDDDRRRIDQTLESHEGEISSSERDFNALEIPSGVFGKRMAESTDAEDRALAGLLKRMWSFRLEEAFPQQGFVVEIMEPSETGGEIAVTFSRAG